MASTAARRLAVISMVGVFAGGTLYCNLNPPPSPVVRTIHGYPVTKSYQREAQGGGFVTVDVAVKPGGVPSWSVPPVSPDTIGYFSNRGEGGKREKRYGWKPNVDTVYDLVLSNDGSGRTKWAMFELNDGAHKPYKSGHLASCDSIPHPPRFRELGFKDCLFPVMYDSTELSVVSTGSQFFFASFVRSVEKEELLLSPAAWISCTTGCCSLGT